MPVLPEGNIAFRAEDRGERKPVAVTGVVVANERDRQFCRLTLYAPEIARRSQPGQFVNVYLNALSGEANYERLSPPPSGILPRPFSVAGIQSARKPSSNGPGEKEEHSAINIVFDLRRAGTRWLAQLTPNAPLRLTGPLGKGFWFDPSRPRPILVAGGIGLAPFPFLVATFLSLGVYPTVLIGVRSPRDLPLHAVRSQNLVFARNEPLSLWTIEEWAGRPVSVAIASEETAEGFFPGTVVDLLTAYLYALSDLDTVCLYACGPMPMLKAVSRLADDLHLPLQVATEERMACGLGLCFGCPIPSKLGSYRLCCIDGPVFDSVVIDWERTGGREAPNADPTKCLKE